MTADPPVPPSVDLTTPGPARLYDYYLGGMANYASGRMVAGSPGELIPGLADTAWADRAFGQRAARWPARPGMRQSAGIGSSLPAQGSTHEVVLAETPDWRAVYVDHDPMVLACADGFAAGGSKPPPPVAACRDVHARSPQDIYPRTGAEAEPFSGGLEMVYLRPCMWASGGADDPGLAGSDGSRWLYCAMARCP